MFRSGFLQYIITILFASVCTLCADAQQVSSFIVALEEGTHPDVIYNQTDDKILAVESIFKDLNLYSVTVRTAHKSKQLKALSQAKGIRYAHDTPMATNRRMPNDPREPSQWNFMNINMREAWDITTGGKNFAGHDIVVGVLDDGYQADHPDLVNKVWINEEEIPDNELDDDANGFIDDVIGWNARARNDDHLIGNHGTSVASIIGADTDNGLQMAGINWDAKIMLTSSGRIGQYAPSDVVKSYEYLYEQRKLYNETSGERGSYVVVSNYSGGVDGAFPEDLPSWCEVFDLLGSVGIVSVGSTTNQGINIDEEGDIPSTCPSDHLIIVTNTTMDNDINQNAGFGPIGVDLGAPGDGVQALAINNGLDENFPGTSAAAPHVAGVISLMYSLMCEETYQASLTNPSDIALQVKALIMENVNRREPLVDITVSGGILDALASLNAADQLFGQCCEINFEEISSTDESCAEANDATLNVNAIGRDLTGSILYQLQNEEFILESSLGSFTDIPAGAYSLIALDEENIVCQSDTLISFNANDAVCPFGEFEIKSISQSDDQSLVTVFYDLDEQKDVNFQIHNSIGQLVFDIREQPSLMETRAFDINIGHLSSGIYYVSILANGIRDAQTFRVIR